MFPTCHHVLLRNLKHFSFPPILLTSVRHFDPKGGENKKIKLLPNEIAYDPKDKRFLPGPTPEDTAYVRRTDDEIIDLTKLKLENEYPEARWTEMNINEEPFCQVLNDHEGDRFTNVTVLTEKDPSLWQWVDRLKPKPVPDHLQGTPSELKHSGFLSPPLKKPDVSYFVPRTRNQLFPVYLKSELPYDAVRNKLSGWIFNKYKKYYIEDPYEKQYPNPMVTTQVTRVEGDLWQFEEDLRGELEQKYQRRILSACNEIKGTLKLKGDYVNDVVQWLARKGF